MEPKLPMPNLSPERAPINPGRHSLEQTNTPKTPEASAVPDTTQQERSVEKAREQLSGVGVGDGAPVGLPTLAVSQAPVVHSGDPATPIANDDIPVIAADEDLIEREWVDKAKRIVIATRDDPYAQEREVSKLQANYLQKRYGKEIKLSNQ